MSPKEFKPCCSGMEIALVQVPTSTFRPNRKGGLTLAVGFVRTELGTTWFDRKVRFCPFCGKDIGKPAKPSAAKPKPKGKSKAKAGTKPASKTKRTGR